MNSNALNHFPKDLTLVILLTFLCILFVVIPPLNEISAIRIIFGLPLVLFLPGYSLIAALFPRKDDLDGIERIALSFGLSIAITPLLGLALNYTPFGIRLSPVLIVLSVFTIALAIGTYIRRAMIPEEDRFMVDIFFGKKISKTSDIRFAQSDYRTLFDNIKESFKTADTKLDRILSVILIISIILAISMTVYVIITPKEGEKFTEFYVLGPNGTASDYPTNLKVGEEGTVIIGIVNHEYANVTYQLEVRLNGEVIGEESIELMQNETWESPFIFKAMEAGENQKLEFLLYKNPFRKSVYGKEDEEEVYRALHLWVDVK
ncbi:DUF1616 domain-containing protein [Methanophagales archaeon]|nr:MAG: DUF1616 domain-containing protein [Methanophagales archaeon]